MTRIVAAYGPVSATACAVLVLSGCASGSSNSNDNAPGNAGIIGPPEISLVADTSNLSQTGLVELSWFVVDSNSCQAGLDWSGSRSGLGSEVVGPLTENSAFELTCSGQGGTATRQINVIVPTAPPADPPEDPPEDPPADPPGGGGSPPVDPPVDPPEDPPVDPPSDPVPTVSLSAADSLLDPGDSTSISWSSTNASSCSAAGGWTNSNNTSGNATVGPLSSTTAFEMSCTGAGGTETGTVTVAVQNQAATGLVTSLEIQDSGSGNGRAVTFGLPLAEGAISASTDLVVTKPTARCWPPSGIRWRPGAPTVRSCTAH